MTQDTLDSPRHKLAQPDPELRKRLEALFFRWILRAGQMAMPWTSPANAWPSRLVTTATSPGNQRSGQTTETLSVSSSAAIWSAVSVLAMS